MATNYPNKPQATQQPASDDLDSILGVDDATLASGPDASDNATWKNAEETVYQPIVITRAQVKAEHDERRRSTVTRAYVNFYFEADPSMQPFVFRSAWRALRSQVAQLCTRAIWPVKGLAVAEMLGEQPFIDDNGNAHYPLRLIPAKDASEAEARATAFFSAQTDFAETRASEPAPLPVQPAPAPQGSYSPTRPPYVPGGKR